MKRTVPKYYFTLLEKGWKYEQEMVVTDGKKLNRLPRKAGKR